MATEMEKETGPLSSTTMTIARLCSRSRVMHMLARTAGDNYSGHFNTDLAQWLLPVSSTIMAITEGPSFGRPEAASNGNSSVRTAYPQWCLGRVDWSIAWEPAGAMQGGYRQLINTSIIHIAYSAILKATTQVTIAD